MTNFVTTDSLGVDFELGGDVGNKINVKSASTTVAGKSKLNGGQVSGDDTDAVKALTAAGLLFMLTTGGNLLATAVTAAISAATNIAPGIVKLNDGTQSGDDTNTTDALTASGFNQLVSITGSVKSSVVNAIPVATNTVQGKVALNTGACTNDDINTTDALTAAGLATILGLTTNAIKTAIVAALPAATVGTIGVVYLNDGSVGGDDTNTTKALTVAGLNTLLNSGSPNTLKASVLAALAVATNSAAGKIMINDGSAGGDDTNATDALTAAGLITLLGGTNAIKTAVIAAVPTVPVATNTVQGKVALNDGGTAGDDTNTTDALTAAGLVVLLGGTNAVKTAVTPPDATNSTKGKVALNDGSAGGDDTNATDALTAAGLVAMLNATTNAVKTAVTAGITTATNTVPGKVALNDGGTAGDATNATDALTAAGLTVLLSAASLTALQTATAAAVSKAASLGAIVFSGNVSFTGTTIAGVVLNNLTGAQRDALVSPPIGSKIFNTTTNTTDTWDGAGWRTTLTSAVITTKSDVALVTPAVLTNTTLGAFSRAIFYGVNVIIAVGKAQFSDVVRFNKSASWYTMTLNATQANGIIRGPRREMPVTLEIMAGTSGVYFIDGDDGKGTTWLFFPKNGPAIANAFWLSTANPSGIASIAAMNGLVTLCIGTSQTANTGVLEFDFAADELARVGYSGNGGRGLKFSDRFDQVGLPFKLSTAQTFGASLAPFAVAMTNLPWAPRDPARLGIPRPVIGCLSASALGASVIRPDRVVCQNGVNPGGTPLGNISFDNDGNLYYLTSTLFKIVPPSIYLVPAWSGTGVGVSSITYPNFFNSQAAGRLHILSLAITSDGRGVCVVLLRDRQKPVNSLWAQISSFSNTGFMAPLAFQKLVHAESSAFITSLSDTPIASDDFTYADTAALQVAYPTVTGGAIALATGTLQASKSAATCNVSSLATVNLVLGKAYRIQYDYNVISGTGTTLLWGGVAGAQVGASSVSVVTGNTGTAYFYYTPLSSTGNRTWGFFLLGSSTNHVIQIDNLRILEVPANPCAAQNLSLTNPLPTVVGTVTRSLVATGCDIAWYNGFGLTNYLSNASMVALGTADWSVVGIGAAGAASSGVDETIWRNANVGGTGSRERLYIDSTTGVAKVDITDGTTSVTLTGTSGLFGVSLFNWLVQRVGNTLELYINGMIEATASIAALTTLTQADALMYIGQFIPSDTGYWRGSIGQIRVNVGYSFNQEQITAFTAMGNQTYQANTKSLIVASPVTMRNTAYDPVTDQWAQATSNGTCVFQGLTRTDYISTLISGNMILASGAPQYWTAGTGSTIGPQISGPVWGTNILSSILDDASVGNHRINGLGATLTVATYTLFIPIKAGVRGFAQIVWGTVTAFVNLTTGAYGTLANCSSVPAIQLSDGTWGFQITFTGTASGVLLNVYAAASISSASYVGDSGVSGPSIYVGDPMIRLGSVAITASDYVFGMSRFDVQTVAMLDNNMLLGTGQGADVIMLNTPLRSALNRQRAPITIDPHVDRKSMQTTDATATFVGYIPCAEGRSFGVRVDVVATQESTFTEVYSASIPAVISRAKGGVATVTVGTILTGIAGTVGGAILAANGNDGISVRVTGKVSTNLNWGVRIVLIDNGYALAA